MKKKNRNLIIFSVILLVFSIFCFFRRTVSYFCSGCYLLYIAIILFLLLFETNQKVKKVLNVLISPFSWVYRLSQNKIFRLVYTSIIVVTLSLAVVVIIGSLILNSGCICAPHKLVFTYGLIVLFTLLITSPFVERFINKCKIDPMDDYQISYGKIVVFACYLFTIVWNTAGYYLIGGVWYSDILPKIVIPAFLSYVIIDRLQSEIGSIKR